VDKWIRAQLLPDDGVTVNISPISGMELNPDHICGDEGHLIFKLHFHNEMWMVLDKTTFKLENQQKVLKP